MRRLFHQTACQLFLSAAYIIYRGQWQLVRTHHSPFTIHHSPLTSVFPCTLFPAVLPSSSLSFRNTFSRRALHMKPSTLRPSSTPPQTAVFALFAPANASERPCYWTAIRPSWFHVNGGPTTSTSSGSTSMRSGRPNAGPGFFRHIPSPAPLCGPCAAGVGADHEAGRRGPPPRCSAALMPDS